MEYVLVEFVNACSRSRLRGRLAVHLDQWLAAPQVLVRDSEDLLARGLDLHHARPDKEWSLTDCISLVVMQDRGSSRALAYDHHFEQAGFEALLRRDP